MKKILIMTMLLLISFPAFAEEARITVNGLVCAFCAKGIEKKFKGLEEISNVDVDLDNKLVTVAFKPGKTILDDKLKELIADAGYNVVSIEREK